MQQSILNHHEENKLWSAIFHVDMLNGHCFYNIKSVDIQNFPFKYEVKDNG